MRVTCRCMLLTLSLFKWKGKQQQQENALCFHFSVVHRALHRHSLWLLSFIVHQVMAWSDTKGKIGICVPFERFLFGF